MEIFIMFCLLSVAFTGLGEGSGVLPDGPLKVSEGGRIMFTTTLSPSDGPMTEIDWRFGEKFITFFNGTANITEPQYEGRISLWMSTGSLELRNVSLNESGQYQVLVKPKGGRITIGTTRLEVYVPVSNVAVTVGSTDLLEFSGPVRLSCSASGQNLSFLWMNGTSEVTAGDGVQITDGGSTVTVVHVTRYDQGPFRCHVSNLVSNVTSDPLHLSISYGPENVILTSPQAEHFEEGSTVTMSCSADSRPSAFYFWFLNGDKLSDSGPELGLMNIQLNQSGNYSCQAFNNKTLKYETSRHAAVHVLERISGASITASSTSLLIEGETVNLTCEAAGSIFTRHWMKDGSGLIVDENTTLFDQNRVLSFSSLKKRDNGKYYCSVRNPISSEEASYILDVYYGPDNIQVLGPNEIYFGQTVELECHTESKPPASYSWELNGKEIHSSSVFTKVIGEFSDNGNYTCRATNNITGRASIAVHRLGAAAPPNKRRSCSAGCIAGIVLACIVLIVAAAAGGAFCILSKRKKSSSQNAIIKNKNIGSEGQDNMAYSSDKITHYVAGCQDDSFQTGVYLSAPHQTLNQGEEEVDKVVVTYAEISFDHNNESGAPPRHNSEMNRTQYAEVVVNNSSAPATTPSRRLPPSYEDTLKMMRRVPQDGTAAVHFAQDRKK